MRPLGSCWRHSRHRTPGEGQVCRRCASTRPASSDNRSSSTFTSMCDQSGSTASLGPSTSVREQRLRRQRSKDARILCPRRSKPLCRDIHCQWQRATQSRALALDSRHLQPIATPDRAVGESKKSLVCGQAIRHRHLTCSVRQWLQLTPFTASEY